MDRSSNQSGSAIPALLMTASTRPKASSAARTIDALAMHQWPSRNHETHAFEVKISRADFRKELEHDCAKSAYWRGWCDYFWIVAPRDVVPKAELPEGWGLLQPVAFENTGKFVLRASRGAKRLRPKPQWGQGGEPLPRGLVSALLRSQVRMVQKVDGSWNRVLPTFSVDGQS